MVGTFPEAGLVVVFVDAAVGAAAPVPFTCLEVDEVLLDILLTVE